MQNNSLLSWCKENRDMAVEALRIYLGLGLIIKGVQFISDDELAAEFINQTTIPFVEYFSIHIVITVHIAGGVLLALGLITRVAALIQVPILFGAVFFVHLQQGLFTKAQNLEFVILVLFLLLFFTVYGGGRLSLDEVLDRRKNIRD